MIMVWSFTALRWALMLKHALAVCSFEDTESSLSTQLEVGLINDAQTIFMYNVKLDGGIVTTLYYIIEVTGATTKRFTIFEADRQQNHLGFDDYLCPARRQVTGAVERYDVESRSESLRHMPMAGLASAVQVEDIFVIIHGRALLQYDPHEDKYIRICSLPYKSGNCSTVVRMVVRYTSLESVRGRWSTSFGHLIEELLEWTQLPYTSEKKKACCVPSLRETLFNIINLFMHLMFPV